MSHNNPASSPISFSPLSSLISPHSFNKLSLSDSFRTVANTRQPRFAKCNAVILPKPVEQPVMRMDLGCGVDMRMIVQYPSIHSAFRIHHSSFIVHLPCPPPSPPSTVCALIAN